MNMYSTVSQTSGNNWSDAVILDAYKTHVVPGGRELLRQGLVWALFGAEALIEPSDIAAIRREYVIPEADSVMSFLRDHRTIAPLLIDAVPHLRRHFGIGTSFSLSTSVDESGWRDLYAAVMWRGEPQEAWDLLSEFEAEWWLANSRPAAGRLTFTYELVA